MALHLTHNGRITLVRDHLPAHHPPEAVVRCQAGKGGFSTLLPGLSILLNGTGQHWHPAWGGLGCDLPREEEALLLRTALDGCLVAAGRGRQQVEVANQVLQQLG